jgi:hypothetical protein
MAPSKTAKIIFTAGVLIFFHGLKFKKEEKDRSRLLLYLLTKERCTHT